MYAYITLYVVISTYLIFVVIIVLFLSFKDGTAPVVHPTSSAAFCYTESPASFRMESAYSLVLQPTEDVELVVKVFVNNDEIDIHLFKSMVYLSCYLQTFTCPYQMNFVIVFVVFFHAHATLVGDIDITVRIELA